MGNKEISDDHESDVEEIDFSKDSYEIHLYTIHTCDEYCSHKSKFVPVSSDEDQDDNSLDPNEQESINTDENLNPDTNEQESANEQESENEQDSTDMNPLIGKAMRVVQVSNPSYIDGKCGKSGKIESRCFHIKSFLEKSPVLYEPDRIVITDTEYNMEITYPLENPAKFKFFSETGFTYKQIVLNLVNAYHEIYKLEDETSPDITYQYAKKCDSCENKTQIDTTKCIDIDQKCSICLDQMTADTNNCKLHCNHVFHVDCIDTWLKKGTNCPECRESQFEKCDHCENGKIMMEYIGKVLPIQLRTGFLNRPKTSGTYGIWGHDIGDLYIERLSYDTANKKLGFFIGS